MKSLNTNNMPEMKWNVVSDYIFDNNIKDDYGNRIDMNDLYTDELGSIYFRNSWNTSIIQDSETGHYLVEEVTSANYTEILSKEELQKLIKKEYEDNQSYYSNLILA